MVTSQVEPLAPMLAKAVTSVPEQDAVEGGLLYEPKWDGFRAIVHCAGDVIEIGSRGKRSLTRYFPEMVTAFARLVSEPCVLDGELVVPLGPPGRQRLDWSALTQRIHPAASRVELLAERTPASFVAFDLLRRGDADLMNEPFSRRREELAELLDDVVPPLHLTRVTRDVATARRWLEEFEGAGLDGIIAKPLAAPYVPGKRLMLKVKHHRTADVVALGYRVHKSGRGLGSLLVGLYDEAGELHNVGGVTAFSDAMRLELIDELQSLVERDEAGEPLLGETKRSRFGSSKDVSFVKLKPERVLEVRYDHLEGRRFRHTAQFERWRPDREAGSCTLEQLEVPMAYDLSRVLE